MKPANHRWYREEPRAPHAVDSKQHPVEFFTKVKGFGFYFGEDRIHLANELRLCGQEHGPWRCDLVAGHGGDHQHGMLASWNSFHLCRPVPGAFERVTAERT